MSRAAQLYRQIVDAADPVQVLNGMISDQRAETEFLEFKGAGRIQDKQIKQFWSQALSGFANTEGGVLTWGIRAARIKVPDQSSRPVDAASEVDVAPDSGALEQLLKDVLLEACIEPIQGVELAAISAGNGDESGFVVCLVPEGQHKPYRAELDPARQYYQRTGDSFVVIPHPILRSLFYPRTAPNLTATVSPSGDPEPTSEQSSPPDREANFVFTVSMCNTGTASAQDSLVVVKSNFELSCGRSDSFRRISGKRPKREGRLLGIRPIHPDEADVVCCTCRVQAPYHLNFQESPRDRIEFEIGIYARDVEPVRSTVLFTNIDIANRISKSIPHSAYND